MTRLSKFSTRELQAEIAKRKKRTQEREYKKLCAQFPCPDCGADPVELSTDMIEEHRFAPRDSEGFPMLYAPYEMGETHGATYRTTIVCANAAISGSCVTIRTVRRSRLITSLVRRIT